MTPYDLYLEPDDEPDAGPSCDFDEPDTDLESCGDYRSDEHDRRLEANYDR
jgi:hypothetical protein